MNRRRFLGFLAAVPAAPMLPLAPEAELHIDDVASGECEYEYAKGVVCESVTVMEDGTFTPEGIVLLKARNRMVEHALENGWKVDR